MKAKTTALGINAFYVESSGFECIFPKTEKEPLITSVFASYPIEIEFNHFEKDEVVRVDMAIAINKSGKREGYRINVKGVGFFQIDSKQLDEKTLYNLKVISTTTIMINNLRNVMAQLTALAPFGVYLLPSIDINSLIVEKGKTTKTE